MKYSSVPVIPTEVQEARTGEFEEHLSSYDGMTPLHASIGAATLIALDEFCRSINFSDHERNEVISDATPYLAEDLMRVGKLRKILAVSHTFLDGYKKDIVASDYLFFDSPNNSKH